MRRTSVLIIALVLSLFAVATTASAQGYGVWEHSACVIGRGGAAVASPCNDGSAIFFNPAGIVLTPGGVVGGSITAINPRGNFTPDTTKVHPVAASQLAVTDLNVRYFPVPAGFFKTNFAGDKASVGFGVFAPYGLTTDWPVTFEGRYQAYKSVVQSLYFQPTVAFKVNDMLSVGIGVDITRTAVELNQRVELSTQLLTPTLTFGALGVPLGTDFANVQLKGHAWHAGVNVGAIVKPTSTFSFGARYMSGQTVSVTNGTVTYTQIPTPYKTPIPLGPTLPAGTPVDALLAPQFATGGKLSNQTASTSLPLPDQFVAGIAIQATPKVLALVDYEFVRWSKFDTLTVTQSIAPALVRIENFKNTSGVRAGIDAAVTPATSIRAGIDVHSAAAPDETVTPLLPEGKRFEVMGGIGQKFGRARIDAYYMYLHQTDRAGRTLDAPAGQTPTTALNNGTYAFMSHLFGVSFAVAF